jgi:hypothetical protein
MIHSTLASRRLALRPVALAVALLAAGGPRWPRPRQNRSDCRCRRSQPAPRHRVGQRPATGRGRHDHARDRARRRRTRAPPRGHAGRNAEQRARHHQQPLWRRGQPPHHSRHGRPARQGAQRRRRAARRLHHQPRPRRGVRAPAGHADRSAARPLGPGVWQRCRGRRGQRARRQGAHRHPAKRH